MKTAPKDRPIVVLVDLSRGPTPLVGRYAGKEPGLDAPHGTVWQEPADLNLFSGCYAMGWADIPAVPQPRRKKK